jgi:hypothetical protein
MRPEIRKQPFSRRADTIVCAREAAAKYRCDEEECWRIDEYVNGYMPRQYAPDGISFYR